MPGVGYATISLVRNLSHNGFVLIIAGTNMEGTEAAGELVTDLPRLTAALRSRGIDPPSKVEQLELLCAWITWAPSPAGRRLSLTA